MQTLQTGTAAAPWNKKTALWKWAVQLVLVFVLLLICVLDVVSGSVTTASVQNIQLEGIAPVVLNEQPLRQSFTAQGRVLNRIKLYATAECEAVLDARLYKGEQQVGQTSVLLQPGTEWVTLQWNVPVKGGQEYVLELPQSSAGVQVYTTAEKGRNAYLTAQPGDELLISLRYTVSVFDLGQKALWTMFLGLLSGWLWLGGKPGCQKWLWFASGTLLLTLIYQYNILDPQNTWFEVFQLDSQRLVLYGLEYEYDHFSANAVQYGLMREDYQPYLSQVGLQGHLFRLFARLVRRFVSMEMTIVFCQIGCSALMAAVACGIVWLAGRRYGWLMAGSFLTVFALSGWVVSFARNLYWVEFTWFCPCWQALYALIF